MERDRKKGREKGKRNDWESKKVGIMRKSIITCRFGLFRLVAPSKASSGNAAN